MDITLHFVKSSPSLTQIWTSDTDTSPKISETHLQNAARCPLSPSSPQKSPLPIPLASTLNIVFTSSQTQCQHSLSLPQRSALTSVPCPPPLLLHQLFLPMASSLLTPTHLLRDALAVSSLSISLASTPPTRWTTFA